MLQSVSNFLLLLMFIYALLILFAIPISVFDGHTRTSFIAENTATIRGLVIVVASTFNNELIVVANMVGIIT